MKNSIKKGDRFGRWTVLSDKPIYHVDKYNNKQKYYTCRCDCGTIKEVYYSNLTNGKSKSCGCEKIKQMVQREYDATDKKVLGKKFGMLTPIKRVNSTGAARYLCKCDCGKNTITKATSILRGLTKSCGCLKVKSGGFNDDKIQQQGAKKLESKRVEGTSLYAIQTKKPSNNTSGYKGVSFVKSKNKYRAYITLRQKQISLGLYNTAEEAAIARKKGEEKYFKPIIDKYKDKE